MGSSEKAKGARREVCRRGAALRREGQDRLRRCTQPGVRGRGQAPVGLSNDSLSLAKSRAVAPVRRSQLKRLSVSCPTRAPIIRHRLLLETFSKPCPSLGEACCTCAPVHLPPRCFATASSLLGRTSGMFGSPRERFVRRAEAGAIRLSIADPAIPSDHLAQLPPMMLGGTCEDGQPLPHLTPQ